MAALLLAGAGCTGSSVQNDLNQLKERVGGSSRSWRPSGLPWMRSARNCGGRRLPYLGEALAVAAIVNTLTEFPQIRQVQILVEGKQVESLAGHVDVSRPLTRNEKLIKRRPEGFLPTSKSRSVAKNPHVAVAVRDGLVTVPVGT